MADRTPTQIHEFLESILHRLDGPTQYLGTEPNAVCKPWESSTVRWLVSASWPYEQAAGNQSIPAVYKQINDGAETHLCDRWYLPDTPRDMKMFTRAGYPIFGIESKHQARDFDVVATSISYPVLLISFVSYLHHSDIPVRASERWERPEDYPMVVIGGQAYGAPESLAPVADAVWCGEVEEEPGNPGIQTFNQRVEDFKNAGLWQTDRISCYKELAREFPFLYFPQFVGVNYAYEDRSHVGIEAPSKQVSSYQNDLQGMKLPILKRHVRNLDAAVPLSDPPLLYSDPGMGTGDLEVGRGCPAWCSFCALTYRQKPYRQKSVKAVVEHAEALKLAMGGTRVVPFSPDFPMHTNKRGLVSSLLEVTDEVDTGAMRVDDFIADEDYVILQVHAGMDSVTLGVEGNSQRMRDLVGKGAADADIEEAVSRGIAAGIRKFKLFMINSMPGEDEGDVFRILRLAKRLADIRERMGQPTVRFQFSWTPLLIEANTPFQWFAPPASSRALADVWSEFEKIKVEFKLGNKSEPNKAAWFQLCQRASREVGEALIDVAIHVAEKSKGCWGGVPRKIETLGGVSTQKALEDALVLRGFHNGYDDCFDERDLRDLFGWEFIDQGISIQLLWQTFVQMREFVEWTESHTYDDHFGDDYHGNEWIERCDTRCYGQTCGVCDAQDLQERRGYINAAGQEDTRKLSEIKVIDERSRLSRVRVKVVKTSDAQRFVMNDHWRYAIRRALFQGMMEAEGRLFLSKRSISLASGDLKVRDFTSGVDYVDFAFTELVNKDRARAVLEAANTKLNGLEFDLENWRLYKGEGSSLRKDVDLSLWELEIPKGTSAGKVLSAIADFEATDYVPLILHETGAYFGPATTEVNGRDHCDDAWLVRDGLGVKLRMLVRGRPNPYEVYASIMGLTSTLEVSAHPAVRLEAFLEYDENTQDLLRPSSVVDGAPIPCNPLDVPYHPEFTPRQLDEDLGRVVQDLAFL